MTTESAPVITIDGPSGAGKGTVAQRIANSFGFSLLDSGALYRLTALAVIRNGVDSQNPQAVAEAAADMAVWFESVPEQGVRTFLNGTDVSYELRQESTAGLASELASLAPLRQQLLTLQRDFRRPPGLVADGRDMGTVVFPDAELKIYLTASAECRAERRLKQLNEKGVDATLGSLLEEIRQRDERDSGRSVAPLKPAADAIVLDSTAMTIDEVCLHVTQAAEQRDIHSALNPA